ncbi:MAG: hypothetical protein R5N92_06190 [Cutibacterium granulosum]|nr:hypothetical protein [Cutibacterium granulosum]
MFFMNQLKLSKKLRVAVALPLSLLSSFSCVNLADASEISIPSVNTSFDSSSIRRATPLGQANPQISDSLLNSLPSSILNRKSLHVDPEIKPNTFYLYENGRVVPGQNPSQLKMAQKYKNNFSIQKTCYAYIAIPATVRSWKTVTNQACPAIIGANSSAKYTYEVIDNPNAKSMGTVTWQPQGYHKVCNWEPVRPPLKPTKKTCKISHFWHAGMTGTGRITVEWGEVAAYPTARFMNKGIYGWAGLWH